MKASWKELSETLEFNVILTVTKGKVLIGHYTKVATVDWKAVWNVCLAARRIQFGTPIFPFTAPIKASKHLGR
jgi:hypothetical protein